MSETQVRHGHAAGLLGIVIKICLSIHIGVVADDLDGVLVRTNGTVSAQTPELTVGGSLGSGHQGIAQFQRQVGNVVHDANGERRLGLVSEYGNDLSRGGVLGT